MKHWLQVVNPLKGIKFAGYVGCQTNRPFGIDGEAFESPKYLGKLAETVGGEALSKYEQKIRHQIGDAANLP